MTNLSAVVVAVGHEQFRSMSISDFRLMCPNMGAVFGDLKSLYSKDLLIDSGFNVFRL